MARKKQKLPFAVGCLAFFLLTGSLAIVGSGVMLAMRYAGHDVTGMSSSFWKEFDKQNNVYWIMAIVQGCIGVPTAIGLFAKKRWAYNFYTIINGFAMGLHGYGVFDLHNYFVAPALAFEVLVTLYMFLPGVRKVFA